MREILFRAWHPDESKYYYFESFIDIAVWQGGDSYRSEDLASEPCAIFEQFTGLIDKNGAKIFEGDILDGFIYPYLSDGKHNYIAEVVWFDDCPAFGLFTRLAKGATVSGISDGNTDFMSDWESIKWEIIGNIHENPELLEVTP